MSQLYMRAYSDTCQSKTMTGNHDMTVTLYTGSASNNQRAIEIEVISQSTGEFLLRVDGKEYPAVCGRILSCQEEYLNGSCGYFVQEAQIAALEEQRHNQYVTIETLTNQIKAFSDKALNFLTERGKGIV